MISSVKMYTTYPMERPISYKMAVLETIKGYNYINTAIYLKTSFFEDFKTQKLSSPRG